MRRSPLRPTSSHVLFFIALQVKWIAAPLAYVLSLTVGVGVYHTLAEVGGRCLFADGFAACSWVFGVCAAAARPAASRAPQPARPHLPLLHCTDTPLLLQAGIVPEVLPELKTQVPIQLSSAALSTLLVLR